MGMDAGVGSPTSVGVEPPSVSTSEDTQSHRCSGDPEEGVLLAPQVFPALCAQPGV